MAPKGLNPVAKKSLQELIEKLPPGSELRSAVERLLQNKSK
jgi:DNA integrity scanning protein DisA with diadenylate cyclase activity